MKIVIKITVFFIVFNVMAEPDGERLSYVFGCINCHHQTPKKYINAPTLLIVQSYTLDQLRTLLKTGKTLAVRDLLEVSSLMGIVSTEQLSYMSEDEIRAVYDFLKNDWTQERALAEEAKIPRLYKADPTLE